MMLGLGKDGCFKRDLNGASHASRPAGPSASVTRDQFIEYIVASPSVHRNFYRVPIRDIISSLASCSSTLSDCVTFRAPSG